LFNLLATVFCRLRLIPGVLEQHNGLVHGCFYLIGWRTR
jgi:hypothetical protein